MKPKQCPVCGFYTTNQNEVDLCDVCNSGVKVRSYPYKGPDSELLLLHNSIQNPEKCTPLHSMEVENERP